MNIIIYGDTGEGKTIDEIKAMSELNGYNWGE